MSEFEGYQESGSTSEYIAAPAETHDAEAGQYPTATATASSLPVDESGEGATGAAAAVNAAEEKINALVEKVGKNGILAGIFVCSLVYTIAAGSACWGVIGVACLGATGYAFTVGLLSAIVSCTYIVLMRFTQLLPENSIAHQVFAWFFLVWWVAGTGTGTFYIPFATTGNGYFAAWGGLLFSMIFLSLTSPLFKSGADKMKSALVNQSMNDQIGLLVCSIVVVVDASAGYSGLSGYSAFAVSLGVVSIVLVALSIFLVTAKDQNPGYVRAFAWITSFLFAWWVIGFCVTTFKAPFNTTGNGYFAAIGGALFSMRLMRTTSLWKAMVTRMGGMVGGSVGAAAATYAVAEEDPQPEYTYANSGAHTTDEGMDF